MAIVGYARVSTREQNLDVQLRQLHEAGVEKIFEEKESGVKEDRPQLAAMMEYIREGDTVVICKLDRIARSTKHLLSISETLEKKGVSFLVLNINLDTTTPTGKLMLTMLGAIATFEREMMLERQLEGIKEAKLNGKFKGRKPTARAKTDQVMKLVAEGKTKEAIAKELGIGIASVFRILKSQKTSVQT